MMDPILILSHRLQATQSALRTATHNAAAPGDILRVAALEDDVARLREEILLTAPAGPVGAAEMIQFAAEFLAGFPVHAEHMGRIADRLGQGKRLLDDIRWLRRMAKVVNDGGCGDVGDAGILLAMAVRGATRPLLVHQADATPAALPDTLPNRSLP